ncbi:MAG: hypothetical protein ACPGVB_10600 [Chitinophagales bacterium]
MKTLQELATSLSVLTGKDLLALTGGGPGSGDPPPPPPGNWGNPGDGG